ncbi:uncharacterized protein LOC143277172 [Babylonia areolata]|uniref:uncharacterized protein LOC143277172 n=1 Tax=Babylonia areolata TaxID=304850 RepID=UPI003FD3065C
MELMLDVPYRCPRCGGARTFTTLAHLKSHMAEEHAYSAQRRQRLRIFDYSPSHSSAPSGRHSPLLQSFLEENQRLEEELKAAKQEELKNQLQRQKKVKCQPPSSRAVSGTSSKASKSGRSLQKLKVNFRTPLQTPEPDPYLQDSLSHLNHEVLVQRHQQWRTADALYSTQDVLLGVEEAAEDRVSEQKNFISELTRQLAEKEQQLLTLRTELETVKAKEKEKDEDESESKNKHNSSHESLGSTVRERQSIEDELQRKKQELENLNKQLMAARQTDNRARDPASGRRRHEQTSEKNREVVRTQRDSRANNNNNNNNRVADISSPNSDGSDGSTTAASATVSRTTSSSSAARNRTSHPKKARHNQTQTRSAPELHPPHSSSYSSLTPHHYRHQHIHNKLRQDNDHLPTQPPPQPPPPPPPPPPPYNADRPRHPQRLKEERELLVQQMKDLLSRANTDKEKLKDQLVARDRQLQALNQELARTRTDQSDLMEETYDLYKEAERSLGKLRERLRAKEAELEQANGRLEDSQRTHERLVAEREGAAKTADDRDALYTSMMRDRELEIQSLKGLLESQQEEREKLRHVADELKEEITQKERCQEQLRQAIADKEEELKKARDDIDCLTQFLQTAAAKESVARTKLEAFVTELIDRADLAERELKHLRGLESTGTGNLTSDPSLSGRFPQRNVKNVNVMQSTRNQGIAATARSTPRPPQHGSHARSSRSEADQILQANLEPWFSDLGVASSSVTVSPPSFSGENTQNTQTSQQQPAPHQVQQTQHDPGQSLPYQQPVPLQPAPYPGQGYQSPSGDPLPVAAHQTGPQQALQNFPPQPQMQQMASQQMMAHPSQLALPPGQTQQMAQQQTAHFLPQQTEQLASLQEQGPFHSGRIHQQRQEPRNSQVTYVEPAQGSPSQQPLLPAQSLRGSLHGRVPQSPSAAVPASLACLPQGAQHHHRPWPSNHQQHPPQQQPPHTQAAAHTPNMARRNTNPFVEVGPLQPPQSLSVSEFSEGFASCPTALSASPGVQYPRNTHTENPPSAPSFYTPQSLPDSEREESSMYAALPRHNRGELGRTDSNPFRAPGALSLLPGQSAAYDGYTDEHGYSSRQDGRGVACANSHNFLVNSSGKVLHKDWFSSSVSTNPFREEVGVGESWFPPAHKSNMFGDPWKHSRDPPSLRGVNRKSISPDRTYPIYCITGREAREPPWEDASDSNCSFQDTPHFNKAVVHRKPAASRGKGLMKPLSGHSNNMIRRKLHGCLDDSSTDGLELSVDENGILWEARDSEATEASEFYRMSPYGSETAGDVDTSVLLSSHHANQRRGGHGAEDTDEDVDSLDDEGILQPATQGVLPMSEEGILRSDDEVLKPSEEQVLQASEEAMLQLSFDDLDVGMQRTSPRADNQHMGLGERINRLLKTAGEDEGSESSKGLHKKRRNGNISHRGHLTNRNTTLVYGTDGRVPRHQTESPLERALAVQNRVKSLTYPRTSKKSVTISDMLAANHKAEPPEGKRVGNGTKLVSRQPNAEPSRPGPNHPTPVTPEGLSRSDGLEDFSSSSYASIPSRLGTQGNTNQAPVKTLETSNTSSNSEAQDDALATTSFNNTQDGAMSDRKACLSALKAGEALKVAGNSVASNSNEPVFPDADSTNLLMDGRKKHADDFHGADHKGKQGESVRTVENVIRTTSSVLEQKPCQTTRTYQSTSHAEPEEPREPSEPTPLKRAAVKPQPSNNTTTTSLTRQVSVSMEEAELQQFVSAAAPPAPANQPRARISSSHSHSSMQSSENESVCASPPLSLPPPQPRGKEDEDSTDFDLESDLEKFGGAQGGLRMGVVTGKVGGKKLLKKLKMRKAGGRKQSPQRTAPDTCEDSSASVSGDAEAASRERRREDARRRRVALFRVFSYLDARALCKVALVCKEWKRVSRHPSLWKHVCLKYDRISSKFLATLAQWCTQVTCLTLEGLRAGSRKPSETLDEYHRRTRGCLEPGLEEMLKASQDSLTALSIVACGNLLTEKCMWLVSGYCRLMQRLTYLSDSHPLTAEVMWALGGGCPSITSLVVPPLFPWLVTSVNTSPASMVGKCRMFRTDSSWLAAVQCCQPLDGLTTVKGMTNRCLMLIAQFYPDLQEVGIGGRSIDLTGLAPLVQSCQRLSSVCVDHVGELGEDTAVALCRAGLRQLQHLEISGTAVTASAIKAFHSSCRHLTEIRVFVCINDYFEDVRKKKNKEEYKKIAASLEALKTQAGLGNILQIRAAPVE